MKTKKIRLAIGMVLSLCLLIAVMGGCAPRQAENTTADATLLADDYTIDSLKAKHANNQLTGVEDYSNKLCLSCHPREAINAATENYGGTADYNPHQSHYAAGDCIACHVVDTTPILTCNECHNEIPPENWISAERGLGPLHDLSKRGEQTSA